MYRSRGRNDFFPSLLLTGRSLEKGLELRLAWREAEIIILNKLRQGFHPDHLELQVRRELSGSRTSGYGYLFLESTLRILINMRQSNQFGGLPTLAEYERTTLVRPHRRRFEMMMYERFTDPTIVRQYRGDYGMPLEADRVGSLDREYETTLQQVRDDEHRRVEEQYRANEEELRAELAEAKFRAESAETRLDIQQQQRSGLQQRQPSNPNYQNDCLKNTSPRNRDYQPQMNGRSRYTPTEGGRTLLPDDMRTQRSFRPGFDDEGMPEDKYSERPDQRLDQHRMSELRYINGPHPNRDGEIPLTPYPGSEASQAQDSRRRVDDNLHKHFPSQQLATREEYPRAPEGPRRQDRDGRSARSPPRLERRVDGPRDEYSRNDGQRRRDGRSAVSSSIPPTESPRHERRLYGPRDRDEHRRDCHAISEMTSSTRRPDTRRGGPADQYRNLVRQRRNLDEPSMLGSSARTTQPRPLVHRSEAPHYHHMQVDLRVRRADGPVRGYAETLLSTTKSSYTDRHRG
ncbi:hypothetical protein BDZ45DRAFT_673763 [Acephala macrosclerotiorum]|nr:hypothetical protein BDZ45DRAFT_673763 [Acephala macrosclerotiorum]